MHKSCIYLVASFIISHTDLKVNTQMMTSAAKSAITITTKTHNSNPRSKTSETEIVHLA